MSSEKPSSDHASEVSELLERYSSGSDSNLYKLLPMVYQELRGMAGRQLSRQRRDHTLQATALINEAYLKLADQDYHSWENRRQFLLVAATVMRRVLVDYARRRAAAKRPQDHQQVEVEVADPDPDFGPDLVALDQVLEQLAEVDERQARVVELRYFAGLSIPETARTLEVSVATVNREWRMARAWLRRRMAE